ncbi:MAG: glycoside hydrolase family 2 TIM barrel-domain containing protein [Acutalibacteraceae bacterium]|nr:glycoside hydrolase family 2 TIM barrel-domain containing protein [Acutalibacteraceae bacterium]
MIPRNEHPNPNFKRNDYIILNGEWDFEFDFGDSGKERNLFSVDAEFSKKINVPFCPESELSGIGYKDFMAAVWYKRTVEITEEQLNGKAFIVFGAVDFHASVYVNGEFAGEHFGGYTSFRIDATKFLKLGENTITVCAQDDTRSPLQARGKQSELVYSHDCDYTRTTGIWQTVYMEFCPENYIKSVKYYPNITDGTLTIHAELVGNGTFSATAFWDCKEVASASTETLGQTATLTLNLSEKHLWEVGKGGLYSLNLSFGGDEISSYFGLREVKLTDNAININGEPVFQRLVLDQGFYPDGIYTAPSAEALKNDILLSMEVGFNGARLHQKIFEPLFLHYCDELGYIVWGEHGNWGADHTNFESLRYFLLEIEEEIERDFNHPSLIGWCPYNETWDVNGRKQDDDVIRIVYRTVKNLDKTRPCIDTSGNFHVETDIFDVHDYDQDCDLFKGHYEDLTNKNILFDHQGHRQTWKGEPVFMSEYGGIRVELKEFEENDREKAWGYGNAATSLEEFYARYDGLTTALIDCPKMIGFCYTQLTDVEQELNGIFRYDRTRKFDSEILYKINTKKAAIEK